MQTDYVVHKQKLISRNIFSSTAQKMDTSKIVPLITTKNESFLKTPQRENTSTLAQKDKSYITLFCVSVFQHFRTIMFQKVQVSSPTNVEHSHLLFNTWQVCSSSQFPNSFSRSVKFSRNYDGILYSIPISKFTSFPRVFLKFLYTYKITKAVIGTMTQLTLTYLSWSVVDTSLS